MRSRRLVAAVVGAVGALILGGCGGSSDKVDLEANMVGAAERPSPGALKGSGYAAIDVSSADSEVCYELTVSDVPNITAAHVHEGGLEVAGPIVAELDAPTSGASEGCVEVEQGVADNLSSNPENFYVNVHSSEFPDGAVRGQVHVEGEPVPGAPDAGN